MYEGEFARAGMAEKVSLSTNTCPNSDRRYMYSRQAKKEGLWKASNSLSFSACSNQRFSVPNPQTCSILFTTQQSDPEMCGVLCFVDNDLTYPLTVTSQVRNLLLQ